MPIIVFSVGYNYFHGQVPSELFISSVNFLAEKAAFFGLRNMGSVCKIKSLLDVRIKEKVVFQPCTTTMIRKIIPNLPGKTQTNRVAFNIAFDREGNRYGENKSNILNQLGKSVHKLVLLGYHVVIIAHCRGDLEFLRYIRPDCKVEVVDADGWNYKKLIKLYNNIDCVIGMRGHAQMIPFGVNSEIITLGSHDKMKWFLEDIDAEDWYIDINYDIDNLCDRVISKFIDIHQEHHAITQERLIRQQDKLWNITSDNMKIISNIIYGEEKNV